MLNPAFSRFVSSARALSICCFGAGALLQWVCCSFASFQHSHGNSSWSQFSCQELPLIWLSKSGLKRGLKDIYGVFSCYSCCESHTSRSWPTSGSNWLVDIINWIQFGEIFAKLKISRQIDASFWSRFSCCRNLILNQPGRLDGCASCSHTYSHRTKMSFEGHFADWSKSFNF